MIKQKQALNDNVIYYYPDDIDPAIAYLNKTSCLNPIEFRSQNCNECNHEKRCVYKYKYKYKKLS